MKIVKFSYLILVITVCWNFKTSFAFPGEVVAPVVTNKPHNNEQICILAPPDAPNIEKHSEESTTEKIVSVTKPTEIVTSMSSDLKITQNIKKQSTEMPHKINTTDIIDIKNETINSDLSKNDFEIKNTNDTTENVNLPVEESELDEYPDFDNLNETIQIHDVNVSRILGAITPDPAAGDFPFAVYISDSGSTGAVFGCTGALLSSRYVLVPASCLQRMSSFTIRAGVVAINGAALTAVLTPIPHPKYRSSPKDYNIALLRLSSPLTIGANISPIDLETKSNTDDNKDIAGETMTVLGFGTTTAGGTDQALRKTDLSVLTKSECLRLIRPYYDTITYSSKQSCLATSSTRALCGLEDLGALVIRRIGSSSTAVYKLIGIVTYVHQTCTLGVPALFTRVGPHYDWIRKNLLIL